MDKNSLLEKPLFRADHKGRPFSLWCNDGWLGIISSACEILENHLKKTGKSEDFKFVQIKEKFGGLRIYTEGYSDDFIEGVVRMAESLSYKTCEITGRPGFLCRKGTLLKTLCPEQAELLGYSKYEIPTTKGENGF
jgi:hypothetical protein